MDASVFVAALAEESMSEHAERFFATQPIIHTPIVCELEVAQALLKKVRRGFATDDTAADKYLLFLQFDRTVHAVPFAMRMFNSSLRNKLASSDQTYLTLANQLDIPLVTADSALIVNGKSEPQIIDLLSY